MTAETNNIIPAPRSQFFDLNGAPLAGGKVYTYGADGSTPKTTYQNSGNTIPNSNPIILDSSGFAQIWGQGQYVFAITDSLGNQINGGSPTQDPVVSIGVSAAMLPVVQAATTELALEALGASSGAGFTPIGVVLPFAGVTAPSGWALCYGQAVSRSAYPNLFAALGTVWGAGDGATSFNLPDMRGQVWAGVDAMGGTAANRLTTSSTGFNTAAVLGAVGGVEQMLAHSHTINDPSHSHTFQAYSASATSNSNITLQPNGTTVGPISTSSSETGISVNITGTGASGNCQPTVVGNYIIQLA